MRWARAKWKSNGRANITAFGCKMCSGLMQRKRIKLKMKSFILAILALVVISVGANQILMNSGFSSADAGTSHANVRLSD